MATELLIMNVEHYIHNKSRSGRIFVIVLVLQTFKNMEYIAVGPTVPYKEPFEVIRNKSRAL